MSFNGLDLTVAVVALLSIALGAWRGFLYELFSLGGWVVAFVVARLFAADVAVQLPMKGASPELRMVVAFVGLFIATAFAAGLLSWLVRKLVSVSGLRPVDRSLGMVFGMARATLILVIVGLVAGATPLAKQDVWVQSASGPWLLKAADYGKRWLPEELEKVLD